MPTRSEWNGPKLQRAIRGRTARVLLAAAILVKTRAKELLSEAHPPASTAGEPPHKRTGRLRASVAHEVDAEALVARVGTNVQYGIYLELGTRRMAARPWLRRALKESEAKIRGLFARKGP